MTPAEVALTIVLLASPATYEGGGHPDLHQDIAEPEVSFCDSITGYNPECGNPVSWEWVEFGTARPITYSGAQFGSQNTVGTQFYDVPAAGVLVHDMKMSNEAVAGWVDFGPAGNINRVSLRLWISNSPDGNAVSDACSYVGYVEARVTFGTDGSESCNLAPGGQYYMNLAICSSPELNNDRYCSPTSKAPENGHRLVMRPGYY